MIKIQRYPRLGAYGWKALVTVGGKAREVLTVGTWFDIRRLARRAEEEMAEKPRRSPCVDAARQRQLDVRRGLQGAAP
ncbi:MULTISPECIES: hypothetical protein [Methylococcus]|uniref:Uncharacterized protein n=1 Tax=Methylococcus capsulatus (strain ATCC 33009 / NCIMB 11132 / Bath) TaxID=243233 RepID=Q602V9_METCA|nr:hypothetical protein [Methylococcus capsulatus]AAU90942.1 hypothetical protein MCA2950 [Methylococcus capsulatus str. Bath]QXP93015.1 hypothetical protein KW113_11675 [Methylococcus capsulatus]